MNKSLSVSLIQHQCSRHAEENLARIRQGIQSAAEDGADLVVLQELHNTVYFCQQEDTGYFDLAEPVPGPTTSFLSDLAREHGLVIIGSVFERRAAGLYHNTAVVLDKDGSLAGKYRKMHIPDDPGYHEKFYFTPGDLGFNPIKTSIASVGVLICWDQWYPEAARLMALAGADLLVFPTAIGWDPHDSSEERERQLDAWMTVQRSHAIANGLPVICCNRTGTENPDDPSAAAIDFWGSSFICGPQGELLASAPAAVETVLSTRIDLERSEDVRRIWPYLRDRRIDCYGDLAKRFRD